MEFASRLRWLILITVMLITFILIGWGLYSIASNLFRSASSNNVTHEVVSYDVMSTSTARLIVDGPVVANSEHTSYSIEVSRDVVSMKVYKKYGSVLVTEKDYTNTKEAYNVFLSALDHLKVTRRLKNTTTEDDTAEKGVCPTGKRYIVELDKEIRRWSTSCSRKEGTAAASMSSIRPLFQRQVVDFDELIRSTNF